MGLTFLGRWLVRSVSPGLNATAVQQGAGPEDAESQFKLGCHFGTGEGADQARAFDWYLKAAGQGHRMAQFNLGLMYGQGKGVLRNDAAALRWLQQAAESGHPGAQYHLGVRLHRASKGSRRSEASESRIEAFKWLQLAVAQAYRGAEAAHEFVALEMTRAEVDEGNRRAATFAAGQAKSSTAAS